MALLRSPRRKLQAPRITATTSTLPRPRRCLPRRPCLLRGVLLSGDTRSESWIRTLVKDELPAQAYGRRLLAEGDSWFTIGTLNPARSSNLLLNLRVTRSTAIVSCGIHSGVASLLVEMSLKSRDCQHRRTL